MKIFLSFLQGNPNHPIPAFSFWEYYIKNGIEEAGHTWVECQSIDWAAGLVPQSNESLLRWKADAWQRTCEYLKKTPVDLFLSYLYPHQIEEQAIKYIQNLQIPCVNFFCDNIRLFKKVPQEFHCFDLHWVPESKATEMYEKVNLQCLNLPMPMWVAPEYRTLKGEYNTQISFLGSKDIQRQLLLQKVLSKAPDLNLAIYGSGWQTGEEVRVIVDSANSKLYNQFSFIKKYGLVAYIRKMCQRNYTLAYCTPLTNCLRSKPSFTEYVEITQKSMITLGINRYPSFSFPLNKPDSYSRLRDIEAPMLGACYLTEYTQGLEGLYDFGNDIETYTTETEMIEKINLLKKDEDLRLKLRLNAQKRALEYLSINKSLEKLQLALK